MTNIFPETNVEDMEEDNNRNGGIKPEIEELEEEAEYYYSIMDKILKK